MIPCPSKIRLNGKKLGDTVTGFQLTFKYIDEETKPIELAVIEYIDNKIPYSVTAPLWTVTFENLKIEEVE